MDLGKPAINYLGSINQEQSPMPGWSTEEHEAFLSAMKTVNRPPSKCGGKGKIDFLAWMDQVSKRVPGKNAVECARCYRHVVAGRVAYFSAAEADAAPPLSRTPSGDHNPNSSYSRRHSS